MNKPPCEQSWAHEEARNDNQNVLCSPRCTYAATTSSIDHYTRTSKYYSAANRAYAGIYDHSVFQRRLTMLYNCSVMCGPPPPGVPLTVSQDYDLPGIRVEHGTDDLCRTHSNTGLTCQSSGGRALPPHIQNHGRRRLHPNVACGGEESRCSPEIV